MIPVISPAAPTVATKKLLALGASLETLNTASQLTAYGARGLGGAIISQLPGDALLRSLGFQLDDVVLKIDQLQTRTARQLAMFLNKQCKPGMRYRVQVLRNQKEIDFSFTYALQN